MIDMEGIKLWEKTNTKYGLRWALDCLSHHGSCELDSPSHSKHFDKIMGFAMIVGKDEHRVAMGLHLGGMWKDDAWVVIVTSLDFHE